MGDIQTATDLIPPAMASNALDALRWAITGRLLRLLSGDWCEDLREYMTAHVDVSRLAGWGPPNTSLNLYKSITEQLGILHDEEPTVRCDGATEEQVGHALRIVSWSRMQAHDIHVVGLRDSLIRIEHHDGGPNGGTTTRLVTPDTVEVDGHPSMPSIPVALREAQLVRIAGEPTWCWHEWSVADPIAPFYRVRTIAEPSIDVTAQALGDEVADGPYPWTDADGPFLPWVITHARDTGKMWEPRYWHELAQATYSIALCWTFWLHALKEASWDQKYAIDVMLQGLSSKGSGAARRSKVTVDPTSLLMFKSPGDGRGVVGSIGASVDPLAMANAIQVYMSTIATQLGISPSDLVASASPQSGISITISRDGLRRMAKRYVPQFRSSDLLMLETIARVNNLFAPPEYPRLPVTGWSIAYPSLPLTSEEIAAMLARDEKLIALGMKSPVDVLIEMDPSLTRETAMARLRQVAAERAEIAAMGKGVSTDTPPPASE